MRNSKWLKYFTILLHTPNKCHNPESGTCVAIHQCKCGMILQFLVYHTEFKKRKKSRKDAQNVNLFFLYCISWTLCLKNDFFPQCHFCARDIFLQEKRWYKNVGANFVTVFGYIYKVKEDSTVLKGTSASSQLWGSKYKSNYVDFAWCSSAGFSPPPFQKYAR